MNFITRKINEVRYEIKCEKKIMKLSKENEELKQKLNKNYQNNLIENLKRQLIREKRINENLRADNLRLMRGMKKK